MANDVTVTVRSRDQTEDGFRSVEGRASKLGDRVNGIAGKIGGLAAAAVGGGVVAFLGSATGAASDLNETMSKSDTIFGAQAKSVQAWAGGAAKSMGLSKQKALESASSFADMFSQIGIGKAETEKMSKGVVQLSADLGSFNNLPTEEVADAMAGAFRGEYDSLQRMIPNINAARVEQEALAATHKKSTSELTAAEKAAAVYAIVQKDGARAAGDFAKTSTGLANSQKIAAARFEDAKAKLGAGLAPIMAKVTNLVSNYLIPALVKVSSVLQVVADWVQRNSGWLIPLAAAVVGVVLALKAWAVAQAILNVIMTANPIGIIIVAIAALSAAIYLLVTHFNDVTDFLGGKWGTIISAAIAVIFPFIGIPMLIIGHWQQLLDFFTGLPGKIAGVAVGLFNGPKNAATDAWKWVTDKFDSLVHYVSGLPGRVGNGVKGLFNGAIDAAKPAFNAIAGVWNNTVGKLSFGIPSWVPGIGGKGWDVPDIPTFKAAGGPASGWVIAGERGPELINMGAGGTVHSNPDTMRMLNGTQSKRVETVVRFGGDTNSAVAQMFMALLRSGQITIAQQYVT